MCRFQKTETIWEAVDRNKFAVIIAKQAKPPPPKADIHIVRAMWICPQAPVSSRPPATCLPTAMLTVSLCPPSVFWMLFLLPPPLLFLGQLSHFTSPLCFCSLLCPKCLSHSFSGVRVNPTL